MRILITGSRDWPDDGSVQQTIADVITLAMVRSDVPMTDVVIVHGDCPSGADRIARDYARRLKALGRPIEEESHPARWKNPDGTKNYAAGFDRNQEMVDLGADVCIAFLGPCRKHPNEVHHSHGATHCANRAALAGIKVVSVMKTY